MAALVTIDELAYELHVSKSTIHRLVRAGLPHVRIGRLVRFRKDRVEDYLDMASSGRTPLVKRRRPR